MKHSKGRREYGELRDMGLLPSEARRVMQIPNWRDTPWVTEMLKEPTIKWRAASRRGVNRELFDNQRVQMYVDRGWVRTSLRGTAIDPFAWIRANCDRYQQDHPDYTSPWQTRGRSLAKEHRAIKNSELYAPADWAMRMEGAY